MFPLCDLLAIQMDLSITCSHPVTVSHLLTIQTALSVTGKGFTALLDTKAFDIGSFMTFIM